MSHPVKSYLKSFYICVLLSITATAFTQPPDTLWIHDYGTESLERVECIRPVPGGDYIICGDTRVEGYPAARTIRIDDDGNVIWSLVEQPHEADNAEYIEPTSDGGFIQGGGGEIQSTSI